MPGQDANNTYSITHSPGGSNTTLNVAVTTGFTSSSGAFEAEYDDEDTGANLKGLTEIRVYTSSSKTTLAAMITYRVSAVTVASGTPSVSESVTLSPAAVDDTPTFPRTVDHSALRTWAQAVTNGSVVVAQYSVSLDVRGDGKNGYTLDQSVLQEGTNTLELQYTVRQGSTVLATGTVQLDSSTTVQSPLVAGSVTYDDSFT